MRRALPSLALSLLLLSCGGDGGSSSAPIVVASVSLSSTAETLTSIGGTVQLSATARDGAGGIVSGAAISWSTSSAGVATVSGTGLVTAVANGTVTITASSEGASATATITVLQAAATIVLSPATNALETGQTLQLVADVQDAGGTALASPSLTWSSADVALATVDQQGLVSALGKGEVVITAAQDGASGAADFTIVLANIMPTQDIVLTGTVQAAEVMIPAGVTVTVTGGLTLVAEGAISIAGSIMGSCESLDLESMVSLTLTGTINTACAENPADEADVPTFRFAAPEMLLDGAAVQISGDGEFVITAPPAVAVGAARGASVAPGVVPVVHTSLIISPAQSSQTQSLARGWSWTTKSPPRTITAQNVTIRAQNGGDGERSEVTGSDALVSARAGFGGGGGRLEVGEGVTFVDLGGNDIQAGHGGAGGPALATALPSKATGVQAPSAFARGGYGGTAGANEIGFGLHGDAGRGGNARATGADGMSAAAMGGVAQLGGDATARPGAAGVGPLLVPEGDTQVQPDPNGWGTGGDVFATGGRGGDGDPPPFSKDGAAGGAMLTSGGLTSVERGDGLSGTHTIMGGRGGDGEPGCSIESSLTVLIRVISDPANSDLFIFGAGANGVGFSLSPLLGLPNFGGKGGDGGLVSITPGSILSFGVSASPVHAVITDAGNGGDGADGEPPGMGGEPGARAVADNPIIDSETGSFMPGQDGKLCGSSASSSSMLAVMLGEQAQSLASQPITFNSADSRWVTVAGTLNDDNTFSADGRGVVAGTAGVLVQFTGTFDPVTGALAGDYTMDPEMIIHPDHPIVYRVETSGG